jgi:hypothetical protein
VQPLSAVIVYATVNHDQTALLQGVREGIGAGVRVVGGSAQGVMTNGAVREGGFVVGAMGLGGDSLTAAAARVDAVDQDGQGKGRLLARRLRQQLGAEPRLVLLVYDPLRGVDVNELLVGVRQEVDTTIVGGGASQPSGPVIRTYQYEGGQAFGNGAVALGLAGDFAVDLGVSHGTSPTGFAMTLTRARGNKLLELDGRPALEVWRESIGCSEHDALHQDQTAALALGVERRIVSSGRQEAVYLIRAVFGFDEESGAIVVQAAIPEGSRIMFHHRSVSVVKEGTAAMASELASRLAARQLRPWAVLGFECGARTAPFLGEAETLDENLGLQKAVAPRAPWLGLLAWGEIAPCGGAPEFHNYTFPLAVLSN